MASYLRGKGNIYKVANKAQRNSFCPSSQPKYLLLRGPSQRLPHHPKPSTPHYSASFRYMSDPHLKLSCSLTTCLPHLTFFFQLLMPPCLEHCLAQSWCSIIDKKKGKRLVRGGVWTWEAGGTSQPVYLENPPLSALPGTLTRPSPPQSSFSSIQ